VHRHTRDLGAETACHHVAIGLIARVVDSGQQVRRADRRGEPDARGEERGSLQRLGEHG
jgi:hypothetical protein